MQQHIKVWEEIFKNKVPDFHNYSEYNGKRLVIKQRKSLGMGKKACEEWADNILNDNVIITVDENFQETFDGVLKLNKFRTRFSKLLEFMFGLGTAALVEYTDSDGTPRINMYRANMIFPLRTESEEIVDCAFASEVSGALYLNIHTKQKDGRYKIENRYFKKNKQRNIIEKLAKKNIKETFYSDEKLFQIGSPSLTNNIELDSSMGVSCYANAIDEYKSIDEAYDIFHNEYVLGKKRVYVRADGLNMQATKDGDIVPIFDEQNTTFYILPGEEKNGDIVRETQAELRIQALIDALETNLNLYGRKVGLGDDYFSFTDGNVYTNTTSVISSNSKFYKTLKKHEKVVYDMIDGLAKAIYYLSFKSIYVEDTTIDFDDSIVEDTEAVKRQAMLELNAGVIDNVQYYQDVYKMNEKQAIKFDKTIRKRKKANSGEEPPIEE